MTHLYDFSDVRGQDSVIDTLASAVARRESVLLIGPPGTGKTMIARRIPTILPPLTEHEQLWLSAEYDALALDYPASGERDRGKGPRGYTVCERPFRAPHHTISSAGLVGAPWERARENPCRCKRDLPAHAWHQLPRAPVPRAAELQLARFGLLFLDELPEFPTAAINALAQAWREMAHATRPYLIASANPCACGWHGMIGRGCSCTLESIARHAARLQGAKRALGITCEIEVPQLNLRDMSKLPPGPTSADIRARTGYNATPDVGSGAPDDDSRS